MKKGQTNTAVVTPQFVTVTKTPANRRPFKLIRKDTEDAMSKANKPVVAPRSPRVRRSDATNKVLGIVFPLGTAEDTAVTRLDDLGFNEAAGYTISVDDDGLIQARRSDIPEGARTSEMVISEDGVRAIVVRAEAADAPESQPLVVTQIHIDGLDEQQIQSVLARCDIDTSAVTIDTPAEGKTVIVRKDVEEGTDTRLIPVEEGVVFQVARADVEDIPEGYVLAVNEAAYGRWGWGQLDFLASMQDKLVSEALDDANYRFRNVIDNILFYSDLTLEAKKALVTRSTEQFKNYINGLLDTLPGRVLLAIGQIQRSDTAQTKENPMGTKTTPETPAVTPAGDAEVTKVERSDAPADGTETPSTPPADTVTDAPEGEQTLTITRADLDDLLEKAVAKGIESGKAQVQRADGETVETQTEATDEAVPLTRSDLEALNKRLDNLVIVRSDSGDGRVVVRADAAEVKRSDEDIFSGALNVTHLP